MLTYILMTSELNVGMIHNSLSDGKTITKTLALVMWHAYGFDVLIIIGVAHRGVPMCTGVPPGCTRYRWVTRANFPRHEWLPASWLQHNEIEWVNIFFIQNW